jgi:hypothetical protein
MVLHSVQLQTVVVMTTFSSVEAQANLKDANAARLRLQLARTTIARVTMMKSVKQTSLKVAGVTHKSFLLSNHVSMSLSLQYLIRVLCNHKHRKLLAPSGVAMYQKCLATVHQRLRQPLQILGAFTGE